MDLEQVDKLLRMMQQYDIGELKLREKDFIFAARRGEKPQTVVVSSTPAGQMYVPPPSASGVLPAPSASSTATPSVGAGNLKEVTAPLVGTFYRQPAPDQAPYKEVGDRVSPDDVICIVEAMKVMNEIKAGISGTVRKILLENGSAVEYGQPLFLVEVG